MAIDLDKLRQTILATARQGPLKKVVEDVLVEPDTDDDGNEFLRVVVKLRKYDADSDADLERVLENIEAAVLNVDSRYPSVRFLDAA